MNIMYLHGYGSSGKSSTVEYLKKALPNCYIYAPDIPVDPEDALPYLKLQSLYPGFDIIIGTSMGAMYAQQLHEHAHYRICVNPAFHLSELPDILKPGTFDFFQPRENGQKQFTITEKIIQHFREMEAHQFDDWQADNPANLRCYGLFGTNDTTVNCRNEFASYYPNVQSFEGGHRMNKKIVKQLILPLVEEMQNRISKACFQGQIEVCSRCPNDKELCRMVCCYADTALCSDEFKKFIPRFLSEYERNKRLERGELVIAETNDPVVHIGDTVYGFSKDMRELYTGKVTKICQYIDSDHYTIEIKMERIIKYGLPTSMTVKMDGLFDYPRVTNDKYYLPNNLSDFVYLKKEDAVKEGLGYNEYILRVTQYAINEIKEKWGSDGK